MNDAAEIAQIKPAGMNFPDFDHLKYIIVANVNDPPVHNKDCFEMRVNMANAYKNEISCANSNFT